MTEPVLDKERANFCELFDPGDLYSGGSGRESAADLVQRARDLFK
jgi:hypothetical protein